MTINKLEIDLHQEQKIKNTEKYILDLQEKISKKIFEIIWLSDDEIKCFTHYISNLVSCVLLETKYKWVIYRKKIELLEDILIILSANNHIWTDLIKEMIKKYNSKKYDTYYLLEEFKKLKKDKLWLLRINLNKIF